MNDRNDDARAVPAPLSLTLGERRLGVLLGIINGFTSKRMMSYLPVRKRQIDDDALWWQSRLHAQNRSELTKISLQQRLLDDADLAFDGSQKSLNDFLLRRKIEQSDALRRIMERPGTRSHARASH